MEWSNHHIRVNIVGLLKVWHSVNKIFGLLLPLKITKRIRKRFVERIKRRFDETRDVVNRPRAGQPPTKRMKKVVKAVRSRINRNPCCKQKLLASDMKISTKTISRILTDDLHKWYTGHLLDARLKRIRLERSKKLLCLCGKKLYKKSYSQTKKYSR